MNLILTGCEWAGKRTLGVEITKWWCEKTGDEFHPPPGIHFHDHYTVPHVVHAQGHESHKELSEKEILTLNPGLLEHFQRYQVDYHFQRSFVNSGDNWNIDWYYADAVFAPFYYGFGRPGEYADQRLMRKHYDKEVMYLMPDTILVLVKASPDAIRQRMKEGKSPFPDRHAATFFKEKDVEYVLARFQDEFENSLIRQRFSIDTTYATPTESLQEFIEKADPYLTPDDRKRMKGEQAC